MKKKKPRGLEFRNAVIGYMFILPFLIGFVFFLLAPLFQSLRMSLSVVSFSEKGFEIGYVGLANYNKALFVDPEFNRFLIEEISRMGLQTVVIILFSFFMAIVLNQNFKGRGIARAIFFLPVILSSGIMVGLEYNNTMMQGMKDVIAQNSSLGNVTLALERLLLSGSLDNRIVEFILQAVDSIYDIVVASGIQILIFLSGLQTISTSMYEAGRVEGATSWELFWKITLPMVSSLILVNLVYTIIDFFIKTNNNVMDKIKSVMVQKIDYGFSSAMAWIYFGIIMLVILIVSGILSKWVFYYDE